MKCAIAGFNCISYIHPSSAGFTVQRNHEHFWQQVGAAARIRKSDAEEYLGSTPTGDGLESTQFEMKNIVIIFLYALAGGGFVPQP